jgi:Ran GTPase-activating protein (RanGAP) involved in mRNA processing and transport
MNDIQGKKGAQGANAPANKKKADIKLTPDQLSLEKIDLSGFRNKRFSRSGLKELIEGISLLPCIRTVILKDNGITDDCETEILELISNPMIKCIDLSKNNIGPRLANAIGRKLKDEVAHIQWIDLTQNEFYNDNASNSAIVQGLKKQPKLYYAGLCISSVLHPSV